METSVHRQKNNTADVNLEARYDLEVERDRLGARPKPEVEGFCGRQLTSHSADRRTEVCSLRSLGWTRLQLMLIG